MTTAEPLPRCKCHNLDGTVNEAWVAARVARVDEIPTEDLRAEEFDETLIKSWDGSVAARIFSRGFDYDRMAPSEVVILPSPSVTVHDADLCDCPPGTPAKAFFAQGPGVRLHFARAHFVAM